jgi:hypothetical protein
VSRKSKTTNDRAPAPATHLCYLDLKHCVCISPVLDWTSFAIPAITAISAPHSSSVPLSLSSSEGKVKLGRIRRIARPRTGNYYQYGVAFRTCQRWPPWPAHDAHNWVWVPVGGTKPRQKDTHASVANNAAANPQLAFSVTPEP